MDRFTRARRSTRDESFGLPAGQVAGFSLLLAALVAAIVLFPGHFVLVLSVFLAAVGAGKLVVGQLEASENDELPPASREFRALADPPRPLTASDPVSIPPDTPSVASSTAIRPDTAAGDS